MYRSIAAAAVLSFTTISPAHAEAIAVVGASVVDVRRGVTLSDQTLVVNNGRIVAVGPRGGIRTPRSARVVDGSGLWVIPGLWDMHVHPHRSFRVESFNRLFVAHGVTGVRDMGGHYGSVLAERAAWRTGDDRPRVVWGAPVVDGFPAVLSISTVAETPQAARALVRRFKADSFDFIKPYDRLDAETYAALLDEAARVGLPVDGHVPLSSNPRAAASGGQRTIEHLTLVLESCVPGALEWTNAEPGADSMELLLDGRLAEGLARYDADACSALFATFRAAGVRVTPTLVQLRTFVEGGAAWAADDPRLKRVRPAALAQWREHDAGLDPRQREAGRAIIAAHRRLTVELNAAGVGVLAGTDASDEPWMVAGDSLHEELALFVDAGMTPMDALRTATLNPLVMLEGPEADPLAKGATADLVLLRADPLADIANTRRIDSVILRGRLLGRDRLDVLLREAEAIVAR